MPAVSNIRRVAAGVVQADSSDGPWDYPDQLWTEAKCRKSGRCAISKQPYEAGEAVYRPVTNQANRSWRVRADVMDAHAVDNRATG